MSAKEQDPTGPLGRRRALQESPPARWERLVEIRTMEDRVRELFFEGKVDGTTHTAHGQEAVAVGLAAAARISDTVVCTYRGHGMALALGITPHTVVGEILGRVNGSMNGLGGSMHLSDPDVGLMPTMAIVGAGIPIAAGAALTAQVRGTDDAAIAVFGDGAANIGAFHEGLNLAAIWQLPVVFLCENNHYGEYSRIDKTTPIEDLARRADAYDMPGSTVDGQDVDVVREAIAHALDRARSGGGPSLIEAKTYRFAGHSRSDKAEYRPPGELEAWQERDPIDLYLDKLQTSGELSEVDAQDIRERVEARIDEAIEQALETPKASVESMFNHVYSTPIPSASSR